MRPQHFDPTLHRSCPDRCAIPPSTSHQPPEQQNPDGHCPGHGRFEVSVSSLIPIPTLYHPSTGIKLGPSTTPPDRKVSAAASPRRIRVLVIIHDGFPVRLPILLPLKCVPAVIRPQTEDILHGKTRWNYRNNLIRVAFVSGVLWSRYPNRCRHY